MKEITGEPKYFRCIGCGKLVTNRMIRNGQCAGHGGLRYAVNASFWEWILVKLRIIR